MTAFYFILLIGVLIFVHELGHFIVAKFFNVKVVRFSIGFGPKLVGFNRGETEYLVAWLPLGGFVHMLGADPSEVVDPADKDRSFHSKPLYQRFLIALAGPAMNLIFPIFIYFVFYSAHATLPPATVGAVFPGTPAAVAGLQPGDLIVRINESPIHYWGDLQGLVSDAAGQTLEIEIERDGERFVRTLVPDSHTRVTRLGREITSGRIGIASHYVGSQIGVLGSESPAALAGLKTWDKVVAADGRPFNRWFELEDAFERSAGKSIKLGVEREGADPLLVTLAVPEAGTPAAVGLYPGELFAKEVEEDGPAWKAGLRPGDLVVRVDTVVCPTWDACMSWAMQRPDDDHELAFVSQADVARGQQVGTLNLEMRTVIGEYRDEHEVPFLGAKNVAWTIIPDKIPNKARLSYAAINSVRKNLEVVGVTVYGFAMIFQGRISSKSLGGPIMIYNIAGRAAEKGWEEYLWVMALISINLGIINLLPIPMLDGGHLLFVLIEAVKRKPISLRTRAIASYVGLSMLIFLMLFAFKNDIERYWDDITSVFR